MCSTFALARLDHALYLLDEGGERAPGRRAVRPSREGTQAAGAGGAARTTAAGAAAKASTWLVLRIVNEIITRSVLMASL